MQFPEARLENISFFGINIENDRFLVLLNVSRCLCLFLYLLLALRRNP